MATHGVRHVCHCWFLQYFAHHGIEYEILPLPTNEANKSFELVFEVAAALEKFGLNRYGTFVFI